ncbi:MAG: hypothetical protein QXQ29_01745 [Candidatus Bathyarchaeia archaeon]
MEFSHKSRRQYVYVEARDSTSITILYRIEYLSSIVNRRKGLEASLHSPSTEKLASKIQPLRHRYLQAYTISRLL